MCEKRESGRERNSTGATYLSHLVVNHHIVWFHITVHDSHTVTVVQGLTHTHKRITLMDRYSLLDENLSIMFFFRAVEVHAFFF